VLGPDGTPHDGGPASSIPEASGSYESSESSAGPIPILLAEDNAADVFLIREAFREHSLNVDLQVVEDGEAAISYIDRADSDSAMQAPAAILLDLNLPRMDGRQVLSHIRHSVRCALVPVIVISSSSSPYDRENASLLGATEFFTKPLNYAEFLGIGKLVKDLLNQSKSAQK